MKRLGIIIAAALLPLLLVGCGTGLSGKRYVESRVELVYPGAEYIGKGESVRETGHSLTDHQYRYNGIDFTVTEYADYAVQFGDAGIWDSAQYTSDYGRQLSAFLTPEKLSELSDGKIDPEKLWVDHNNDEKTVYISCQTGSYEDIPKTVETYKNIYDAIYDYLPDNSGRREEHTQNLPPHVEFAINVPTDDEGNFSEADEADLPRSGYIFVFTVYSREDIIDWDEVENITRYYYNYMNSYLAEQGIKSSAEMSESDAEELETKQRNDFNPVYYSPETNKTPQWDEMSTDVPR